MKGRKPKPTALRLIEGNREHRTIHERGPTAGCGGRVAPKKLKVVPRQTKRARKRANPGN
jgi:hypothetical protein